MTTLITMTEAEAASRDVDTLVLIGPRGELDSARITELLPPSVAELWSSMLESLEPGRGAASTTTWTSLERPRRVVAIAVPETCSRHNSPSRPDAISTALEGQAPPKGAIGIVVALTERAQARAAAAAVARAFPSYSRKSSDSAELEREVLVGFSAADGEVSGAAVLDALGELSDGVRLAASLVDTPTAELGTDAFVDTALGLIRCLPVESTVIRGEELGRSGFGGLWGVGRAASQPPALVVLSYYGAQRGRGPKSGSICWVGKGIVYDTGGLSLKTRAGMIGMKGDMAGAAAVLGGFLTAVKREPAVDLHAILCLAENAIGPDAIRPDDVVSMYSGRTVEINNTDAEGRLVLADGVAYAARHLDPKLIVDIATLTGAQLVATGRRHAAIVTNDEQLESVTLRAGRACGDLVHPLPYCPELFCAEFKSPIADMKNSVKDRMNAQSSCAAQFIAEHLVDYDGPWLHVDMAGPSGTDDRASGYGVALLVELLERWS